MTIIEVTFEETVRTVTRLRLSDKDVQAMENRLGPGPHSETAVADYLDENVAYYYWDDEQIVEVAVTDRGIENARLLPATT